MPYPVPGVATATLQGTYLSLVTGFPVRGRVRITPEAFIAQDEGLLVPHRVSVPLNDLGQVQFDVPCGTNNEVLPLVAYRIEELFDPPDRGREPYFVILTPADQGQTINLATIEVEYVPDLSLYMLKSGGTFTGPVAVHSTLTVTGQTSLDDVQAETLTVSGDIQTEAQLLADAATIDGNLTVGGNTEIDGDLEVGGTFEIDAVDAGSLSVTGDTLIGGNATIGGNLSWSGAVAGNLGVSGSVTATGAGSFGSLTVAGSSLTPTGLFNVRVYGATGNGTTNDQAAVQAAVTAAQNAGGGVVYFPAGKYLLNSTVTVSASNVVLIGEQRGAVQIINGATGSASYAIRFTGTLTPAFGSELTTLSGNAGPVQADPSQSRLISLTDASGVSAGDVLLVGDNYEIGMSGQGWGNRFRGEYVRVKNKAGSTLSLYTQLRDPYTTARSAAVWKPVLVTGCGIANLTIVNKTGLQGTGLNAGVQFYAALGGFVRNCEISGMDNPAVSLLHVLDTVVEGCFLHDLTDDTPNSRYGYGVVVGASEGVLITGNVLKNARHGVTTGAGNNQVGWCRNLLVSGNLCEEMSLPALDTHPTTTDVAFIGNRVDRGLSHGIAVRSERTRVCGNDIARPGADGINLQLSDATDVEISENRVFEPSGIGLSFSGNDTDGYPSKVLVRNNIFIRTYNAGVRVVSPITNLSLIGNYFLDCYQSGPETGAAISVSVTAGLDGAKIIGNTATSIQAVIAATGGTTTNLVILENKLVNGAGTTPSVARSTAVITGTGNSIQGNAIESRTDFSTAQVLAMGIGTTPLASRPLTVLQSSAGEALRVTRTTTSDTSQMVNLTGGETTTTALGTSVSGDTSARFSVKADGTLSWGPGNAGADTSLYRLAANQLALGSGDSIFLPNITTPATPTGGAVLFANAGELKAIDSSGNVTTLS